MKQCRTGFCGVQVTKVTMLLEASASIRTGKAGRVLGQDDNNEIGVTGYNRRISFGGD